MESGGGEGGGRGLAGLAPPARRNLFAQPVRLLMKQNSENQIVYSLNDARFAMHLAQER